MPQAKPPYRAEHIGSLPRPAAWFDAREQFAAGKLTRAALTEIEDGFIRDAVAMQARAGIGAITDGEFRKRGWREFIYDRCEGFGPETVTRSFPLRLYDGSYAPPIVEPKVTGKLRRREPLCANDFTALKAMTSRPIKANLPTPSVAHFFTGEAGFDKKAYATREEFMAGHAAILREEVAELAARGCTYLQMDEVPLAVICDPKNMETVRARGEDPDELIDLYVDAIAQSIAGRPATMTIGVHLCRGNFALGMGAGGYEPIAERLFNRLADVDCFFLEYDTPRSGDFAPLRHLPKSKNAVLGIMSTKLPELESIDDLRRRVDEAATFVDIERLGISPQCGFVSVPSRVRPTLGMDVAERKLARLVETAHAIWG
jgi:5-methyltetrahydropteroyltriglutamate--homocysteine methyltransferase